MFCNVLNVTDNMMAIFLFFYLSNNLISIANFAVLYSCLTAIRLQNYCKLSPADVPFTHLKLRQNLKFKNIALVENEA